MGIDRKKIREAFEDACNAYLNAFCIKHGYDYNDAHDSWVAGDVGDIVMCGDQFVSLGTIRTDIDMDAPEEEFLKWYDYTTETAAYSLPTMNYQNWLKGAPRISRETIDNIKARKRELDDLIKEAEDIYKGFD